jgi:hypothetical protein
MTPLQYWSRWAIAGGLALLLARLVLVNPVIHAIQAIQLP